MLHCNITSLAAASERGRSEPLSRRLKCRGQRQDVAQSPRRRQSLVADQRATRPAPRQRARRRRPRRAALPAPANRARYDLIDTTTEMARRAIAVNALRLSMEFVDRQRNVIDAIHKSTIATLRLAEAIGQAAGPARAQPTPCFHHRRERAVAVHNSALDFFHSAISLIGVIASAGPAARDRETPVRADARAGQTVARCVGRAHPSAAQGAEFADGRPPQQADRLCSSASPKRQSRLMSARCC